MKIAVVCVLAMLGTCGMCDTMYWQISNGSGDVTYAFANGLDRRNFVSGLSYLYGCHPENVASAYEGKSECGFIDNMNLLVETMKTISEGRGGSDLAMERCFVATVVPEPSTSLLCIIGFGMLMLRRKTSKWENG